MKGNIYKVYFAEDSNRRYFSALSSNRKLLSAFVETLSWLDIYSDKFRIYLYACSEFGGDAFTIKFRYSLSSKDSDGYNGVQSYLHSVASALRRFNSDYRSKVTISPTIERYSSAYQMVDVEFKCWYDLPF